MTLEKIKPAAANEETNASTKVDTDSGLSQPNGTGWPESKPKRKPLSKRDKLDLAALLAQEINTYGPRQPEEFAKELGLSKLMVTKCLAIAMRERLVMTTAIVPYQVILAKRLPKWQRELLQVAPDDLIHYEHDNGTIMVSVSQ